MTGEEVKQQVMEALELAIEDYGPQSEGQGCYLSHAALAPCVVLTREDAGLVLGALRPDGETYPEARALLSPPEEQG